MAYPTVRLEIDKYPSGEEVWLATVWFRDEYPDFDATAHDPLYAMTKLAEELAKAYNASKSD